MRILVPLWLSVATFASYGQQVHNTFTTTRVVGSHSTETLRKRILEFRITHRFGDLADSLSGWNNFFGFDDAQDIRYSFEYGITNELMVGIGRCKGAYQRKSIVDAFAKYRLLTQTENNSMPLSLALLATGDLSTMRASSDSTKITSFPKFIHRSTYVVQAILARKFHERFSLQLMPTFVHRNFVLAAESNDVFALGAALRFRFYKQFALLVDYYFPLTPNGGSDSTSTYSHPLGIGFELETGGHVFTITFTNSAGITENQFIPDGSASWLEGEFRFGFTISRKFKV
jgi:hypothetical protein